MARCPPANQDTAKTKTRQGNDRRASKSVIVIGDDLVRGSAKETPGLRGNERPVDFETSILVSNDSRLAALMAQYDR